MSAPGFVADPRFGVPRLLQGDSGSRRGGGNWLLLYGEGAERGLLKVYRHRGSARRERAKRIGVALLEGKQGVLPRERCVIERRNLALWRDHGCDVPALLDRPTPRPFANEPATWLEYCPGPTLWDVVGDAAVPLAEREAALARAGRELGRRQALALESAERDLVMKHGSLKHVLVVGERQVTIDLEGRFRPTVGLLDALAEELAGFVRSLRKGAAAADLVALGNALARGHASMAPLREIVERGTTCSGLRRRVKTWSDRRRRGAGAKAAGLRWLLERAEG